MKKEGKKNSNCPELTKYICITDSVVLGAELSSLFAKKKFYFPVIEPPRVTRPDASNEAIKINNTIARMKPDKIIFAGLNEEQERLLFVYLPKKRVIQIKNSSDIERIFENRQNKLKGQLFSDESNLFYDLYIAIKTKKKLKVSSKKNQFHSLKQYGLSGNLVISENRTDITSIIATNYAISLDSDLIFINPIKKEITDEIMNSFFNLYSKDTNKVIQDQFQKLIDQIKSLIPYFERQKYQSITFISDGIPFGVAFPEKPTCHLLIYPLLGINICDSIASEKRIKFNCACGLLVDPSEFPDSEIEIVKEQLYKNGLIVRLLKGAEATVRNMFLFSAAFPYDLMLISSHANEASGYRCIYEYTDSEGIDRKLEVDEGLSFGWDSEKEMFDVFTLYRFVSLDGINWNDKEAKKKHYIGKALTDFAEDKTNLKPTKREKIPKVYGVVAYKMFDHNFIPKIHGVGNEINPVIISNACSSWREISKDFIFAGARVYIGPIIDITNVEAVEVMKILFKKYINLPLSVAIWKAQKDVYGNQIRRPYIFSGTHFSTLKFVKSDSEKILYKRLLHSINSWRQKAETHLEEDIRKNSKDFYIFLKKELNSLISSANIE